MKPRLALTMGDINGIGPEILAKSLARKDIQRMCSPVVIGSAAVLSEARRHAPDCPRPAVVSSPEEELENPDVVAVLEEGLAPPPLRPGTLDAEAGRCAVEWLKSAVAYAMADRVDGIVTCPLNKEGIHRAGYPYAGHTDLIAEMTQSPDYRMSLFAGSMRVVHITGHLSLSEALKAIRRERIVRSVLVADEALRRLGCRPGRIAVAGANPHAGEAGSLGNEEIEEIAPAVKECQALGVTCSGPYPPDTVFRRMQEGEFDLVVAMYHDQGHIPMKLIAMDEGVNVTLGIPIIRTSCDHGTAYDKAGKGIAREDSLCAAIALASQMAATRRMERSS